MNDAIQLALAIIGGVGGLIGMWSAVATVRRDRARIVLELGFCKANTPSSTSKAIQVISSNEARPAYYLTLRIRNTGYRPAFLEEVEFDFERDGQRLFQLKSPCEVVLEETRRSHTIYFDLTNFDDRPVRLAVTDHRGTKHRARLMASRALLWAYGAAPAWVRTRMSNRLWTIAELNRYYADEDRDPFRADSRTQRRERVAG